MLEMQFNDNTALEAMVGVLTKDCESPIEEGLMSRLAWHLIAEAGSRFCAIVRSPFDWKNPDNIKLMSQPPISPPPFNELQVRGVAIAAQVVADRYRADFALQKLYVKRGEFSIGRTLLVECDGHEYHNKHEWQVSRDETRDQHIMKHFKCSILRLRGFEIHSNAQGCAAHALDILDGLAAGDMPDQRLCGLEAALVAGEGEDEEFTTD